jgi:tRNA (adenine22-N1)-methyltransferase
MADIGSDHALLPTYLAGRGRISFAIAGEVNDGPFEAARKQVMQSGLKGKVDVRLGNGLAVISPHEVDVITIAGMGGSLIARILEEGQERLPGVKRLILQPNVAEDQVRIWLRDHDWYLEEELMLEEDGHIYEVLVAVRASEDRDYRSLYAALSLPCGKLAKEDLLIKMGPWLLRHPTEVFIYKWQSEADKLDKICMQMEQSGSEAALERLKTMRLEAGQIREVIACLLTETL